jgi:hypothetical protein
MHAITFKALMTKARMQLSLGQRPDYWHGYERGLRRGFHGDRFGTEQDHKLWLSLVAGSADGAEQERGRGYRDGLSACARGQSLDYRDLSVPESSEAENVRRRVG